MNRPWKVQDRDKPGACHQGYMWVRYAPLSKSVLFEYYKSRSTKGPIDDLATFKDTFKPMVIRATTYLASQQGITHLSCWAHARRYFDKALENDRDRASHVMKLIQLLYAIEALARESEMSHQQRYALRLDKIVAHHQRDWSVYPAERNKCNAQKSDRQSLWILHYRWISLQNYLTQTECSRSTVTWWELNPPVGAGTKELPVLPARTMRPRI